MDHTLSEGDGGHLLLTAPAAANLLSISPRTLWARTFPRGPIPVVKIPGTRAVRYSLVALKEFVEAVQEGVAK
jgi:hypothetical protein